MAKAKADYENSFLTISGKKYYFDVDKLNELCRVTANGGNREKEITESYELSPTKEMELTNKIEREYKTTSKSVDDIIMYDVFKMFLDVLLGFDSLVETAANDMEFTTSLAFNTLLTYGLLVEIK